MTLDQLIAKYNGKQVEVAGSAGAEFQCVDLANLYIRDVLGLPIIEWTDAKDFLTKAGPKYTVIKNTPTGVPQKGDIIVWNSSIGGGHGHIAIVISATEKAFVSFDQNFSQPLRCTIENHNYNGVDGWMRPKEVAPLPETITIDKSIFEQLVTKATKYDELVKEGYPTVKSIKDALAASEKAKSELEKDNQLKDKSIANLEQDVEDLQIAADVLGDENKALRKELTACENKPSKVPAHTEYNILGTTLWILSE